MTNQDIYDLIACFDRSTAQTMRLSLQDFTIELTRGGARVPEAAAPAGGLSNTATTPLTRTTPEQQPPRIPPI